MTFSKNKKLRKAINLLMILSSLFIIFIVGPFLFYSIAYMGKIYPNIYVGGINLGGLTPVEANTIVSNKFVPLQTIRLVSESKNFSINTSELVSRYNYPASINRAYNIPRSDNLILDTLQRFKLLFSPIKIGIATNLDSRRLTTIIDSISNTVTSKPKQPTIEVKENNVYINNGEIGSIVDRVKLESEITSHISMAENDNIYIPVNIVDTRLSNSQIESIKEQAQKYVGKTLLFKLDQYLYKISDQELVKTIGFNDKHNNIFISTISDKIASDIYTEPQIPRFEFDGKKVTIFTPATNGVSLDESKFKQILLNNLELLANTTDINIDLDIPIIVTAPPVSTSQVNNLGIKELIGHANSTYFHSIPGRVFNVNLAASRINGSLVAPGETFSFNQALGDVSKFSGYKEAYIISGGKTVLGDGGGVCQVSTTLFRATLNAGLPIDERRGHAYRVGYYEQNSPPGIDATVYSPTTDFKFTNDTGNYILIQAKNDPNNFSLVFDLYGTSDGRKATITKPIISNYAAPLPTVYQDDPTLPTGTLKQVDFAAAGAKITFDYKVERTNQIIYSKTFVTNYQPWADVYLRGTKI